MSTGYFNTYDQKWARPDMRHMWNFGDDDPQTLANPDIPVEERRMMAESINFDEYIQIEEGETDVDMAEYTIPGCPEEPEAEVKVYVYTPKSARARKNRAVLQVNGGGLMLCVHLPDALKSIAKSLNCIIVEPIYRTMLYGQYPAAVNDMHATYQWMLDNADELRINPDKIVLLGSSSGAHLATVLPFRLKRYGINNVRGVVASCPLLDDREHTIASTYPYAKGYRNIFQGWLGRDYCSATVGPEAVANHASVSECIGYPPLFIHTVEFDPDADNCLEFVSKVRKAKSFAEIHEWGGLNHMTYFNGYASGTESDIEFERRIHSVRLANVLDCFDFDLRRPWVEEELKENGPWW